jgi:alanine racemase
MNVNRLEIDLGKLEYNLKQIQKCVGDKVELLPVIKANAYGIGAVALKDTLEKNKINYVAVAMVREAIELRNNGFKMPIMVLNEILECEIEDIVKYNLTSGISTYEIASKLNEVASKNNTKVKVHIKIDTGMGRVGLIATDSSEFEKDVETIEKINELKNIEIEGIYSHLASPDSEKDYTNKQISLFDNLLTRLADKKIDIKYKHILASTGITDYTYAAYNMVRPGIIIYGHTSRGKMQTKLDLKPCTKLLSKIAYIKNVPENTSISYGRTYITKDYTKVATVPIGYADGIRRELSNKGYVYINGVKAPIIGVVCMDNFMVDVTKVPNVKVGDDVAIWDNEHITLEEVASKCNTIVHDILCGITNRVERVYTEQ